MKKSIKHGYLYIILSAVLFGCMPLMARHIYADGVNSMTLVFFRNVMSLPFLAGLAYFKRESFKVNPKSILPVFVIGVFGCALTPLLLFSSYNYINGGTATVFHFVYPAVVLLLEIIILRTKICGASIAAILLCLVGIALFYNPAESLNFAGGALAISSGVTYAIYIFLLGRFDRKGMGGYVFAFFVTLISTVVLFVACLVSGSLAFPRSALGWILCLAFAVMINVGAVVLFQSGTFIIGGEKAAIISTFEPITSLVVCYFAFGEGGGWLSIVGSVLVISATVLIAMTDSKKTTEQVARAGFQSLPFLSV